MTVIIIWMESMFQTLCQAVWCIGRGPGIVTEVPVALLTSASEFTTIGLPFILESASSPGCIIGQL